MQNREIILVKKVFAMAGNRTRVNCLEGNYANHYTTIASCKILLEKSRNTFRFRYQINPVISECAEWPFNEFYQYKGHQR
jgi:hypothetical protein